jgi:hypothetical protein|tara:strand:- start:28 stop:234 length:207 start_codon:yes stop_codon:yes gene_type:complete
MALSSTDIDNLIEAIASGVLTVSQNGKSITYRSLDEMKAALAFARGEVDGNSYRSKRVTLARSTRRRR